MKVVKVIDRNKWKVEGDGSGWVFNRTFATKWRAELALSTFQNGGRISDYWKAARFGRKANKPLSQKHIDKISSLERRISLDRKDSEAYYELAVTYLESRKICVSISSNRVRFWKSLDDRIRYSPVVSDSIELLNTALAIGLNSLLDSASAKYILISLLISKEAYNKSSLVINSRTTPRIISLSKNAISDLNEYLLIDPYNLKALHMQKALHSLIQDHNNVGRYEQLIQEAVSLKKLGIREPKHRRNNRSNSSKVKGISFEKYVQEILEKMGFKAINKKQTADGGIDIVAISDIPLISGKYIVQCKDWNNPVGEPVVRDLYGVVLSEGANKGIIITTSKFTQSAKRFAKGKPIELIDGERLKVLENQVMK